MKNSNPEINASSMADIAFLLLIFFLMVTTINSEKGISVKLPPLVEEPDTTPENQRNVLRILTNNNNEIMVNDEIVKEEDVQSRINAFVLNNGKDERLSVSPQKAVISLFSKDGTEYWRYLSIHNEVRAVYNQLWNEEALKTYNETYFELSSADKKAVRANYPLRLSEAESK